MRGESDKDRFRIGMAKVFASFPNAVVEPLMIEVYWEALKDKLEVGEFESACCDLIIDRREFPPRPGDFLETLEGDVDEAALEAWSLVIKPSSFDWNGRTSWIRSEIRDRIGERGCLAIDSIGQRRLADAEGRDLNYLRRDFLKAYQAAARREKKRERLDAGFRTGRSFQRGETRAIGDVLDAALPQEEPPDDQSNTGFLPA